MNTTNQLERWALITGASSGIGLEFAKIFAANGFNIVLVARRKSRLDDTAAELEKNHPIKTKVIDCDLSIPNEPEKIFETLQLNKIHVDVLVNNAGYGINGSFANNDWKKHADFIQVLGTSVIHLCHLLIPGMKERKYGRIINLSSLAAHAPDVTGSLYSPIKDFILRATIAMDLELRPHGIHCTALCPGFTHTEFHDVMGVKEQAGKLPSFMWMDSKLVAHQGYHAVMRGDVVYTNGFINRILAFLFRMLPIRARILIIRKSGSLF